MRSKNETRATIFLNRFFYLEIHKSINFIHIKASSDATNVIRDNDIKYLCLFFFLVKFNQTCFHILFKMCLFIIIHVEFLMTWKNFYDLYKVERKKISAEIILSLFFTFLISFSRSTFLL